MHRKFSKHDSKLKSLSVTTSFPSLFNYSDYSSLPSPYPTSPIKLSSLQNKKWLDKEVPAPIELDESDHEIFMDDDEPEQDDPRQQVTTPAHTGTRAMLEFFTKYKNLYKNTSPAHSKSPSASYAYLLNIDKMKRIPHPMGLVKWKGQPNELNLQYPAGVTFP